LRPGVEKQDTRLSFSPASEYAFSLLVYFITNPHGEEAKPMHKRQQFPNVIFGASLRPEGAALAILVMLLFLLLVILFMTLTAQTAQAQTLTVIHNFTSDTALPLWRHYFFPR
jgi:hypothetical protein